MSKTTIFFLISLFLTVQGCSSIKTYENDAFPPPESPWFPINPENFGKTEAQRVYEGRLGQ